MTIDEMYAKLNSGAYKNTLPYGTKIDDRRAYGDEEVRLNNLFYKDACASFGLDPSKNRSHHIFAKAYQDGHSNGYGEVYWHFMGLVEFLRELEELA